MLKVFMAIAASAMFSGSMAAAHDTHSTHDMDVMDKELTKEQRTTLAEHYEKMAACLHSDKTLKECHEEAKKHCEEAGDKCPMNEKMGHDKMHDHAKMNKSGDKK